MLGGILNGQVGGVGGVERILRNSSRSVENQSSVSQAPDDKESFSLPEVHAQQEARRPEPGHESMRHRLLKQANRGRTSLFDKKNDVPLSIALEADGRAVLIEDLKLKRLVMSGGGAKGVVYAGLAKALETKGQMEHIREIGGSSAGAITASLLASGMSAEKLDNVLDNLNLASLFDKDELPSEELLSSLDNIGQVKALLGILTNLGNEGTNIKKLIDLYSRRSALERIDAVGKTNDEVNKIREKLKAQELLESLRDMKSQGKNIDAPSMQQLENLEAKVKQKQAARDGLATLKALENRVLLGEESAFSTEEKNRLKTLRQSKGKFEAAMSSIGNLTFGDLHTLSKYVPGIKQFYCTGTAIYSGDGVEGKVPQLTVFSSEDKDVRDVEISHAACLSGAIPVIFKEFEQAMPHDLADGTAETRYADGGLMLNTPVRELIDPNTPQTDSLVITLEGSREPGLFSRIIDKYFLKGKYGGKQSYLINQLEDENIRKQIVEGRLKDVVGSRDYSGALGILAVQMTKDEKNGLQNALYEDVVKHLESRNSEKTYKNLDQLLYSMEDEKFNQLAGATRGMNSKLVDALGRAADSRLRRDAVVSSLKDFANAIKGWDDAKPKSEMIADISEWMKSADKKIRGDENLRDIIAESIVYSTETTVQRMLDILRGRSTEANETSGLLKLCRQKDEEKACKNIAGTIIRDFIYPVMSRLTQTGDNKELLVQAEKDLKKASTKQQINEVLKRIEANYEVLGTSALNGLSSAMSTLRTYMLSTAGK